MNEFLETLALCKWAPSGGNSQPWDIRILELNAKTAYICLQASKDCKANDHIMEANGYATLYSLGTLSHTIVKALKMSGWSLNNELFNNNSPANTSPFNCSIRLSFVKLESARFSNEDIEVILRSRKSNRSVYESTPLSDDVISQIACVLNKYPELELIQHTEKIKVAHKLAKLENIRCQNLNFSNELLREIHFHSSEVGLSHKTLGQPSFSVLIMHLWKKFSWMRFLFFMGGQWVFRYLSAVRPMVNSGALFTLQADQLSFKNSYQLGKCLAEVWFLVEEKKLAMQTFGLPIIFLFAKFHPIAEKILSKKHLNIISKTQKSLKKFNINIDKPCLLFRCGVSNQPAFETGRQTLKITLPDSKSVNLSEIQGE